MDSAGRMLKEIWRALQEDKLTPQKIYSIYSSSVPRFLGFEHNKLEPIELVPYMFDPLEKENEL